MGQRLLRLAPFQEDQPEVTAGLGRPRGRAARRRGSAPSAAVVSPLSRKACARLLWAGGEVGREPEGVTEVADRGVDVALAQERRSKVAEGLGVVGLEPQRSLDSSRRRGRAARAPSRPRRVWRGSRPRPAGAATARPISAAARPASPRWSATRPRRWRASGWSGSSARAAS